MASYDTVKIQEKEIRFLRKENSEENEKYRVTYDYAETICDILHMDVPNIAIDPELDIDKFGFTYHKKDWKLLEKSLIVMRWNESEFFYIGMLAHELRHVWQGMYARKIMGERCDYASTVEEAASNPAEIDADGFAVYYLHKMTGKSMDECAEIFLADSVAAISYARRLDRAEEIADVLENGKSDRAYRERAVKYYKENPIRKMREKRKLVFFIPVIAGSIICFLKFICDVLF